MFTNWAQGQYNTGPRQYCAVLSDEFNGQWKTVECSNNDDNIRFNYICKKNAIGYTPQTPSTAYPTPSSANYGCQKGWYNFKTNYCYKYYNSINDHKSFDEAKAACKQEKADLAEVFSEGENEFLVSLLQRKKLEKNPNFSCPSGWVDGPNNLMCYKALGLTTNRWDLANNYCKNRGGYLANIKNSNENDFVSSLGICFLFPKYFCIFFFY